MDVMRNLLGDPDPTYLDSADDAAARQLLTQGQTHSQEATTYPHVSYPWALLAREALAQKETIAAYAYARTGYHRGLDALRRAGWKGHGPVPASHEPNEGFLMALLTLGEAAERIGEDDEALRCEKFARDCDPDAAALVE